MKVTIDHNSGYCFGVEYAIQMAEDEIEHSDQLYCLGDIVHNDMEVQRLRDRGLRIIDRDELKNLKDCRVLIRAHGEPPETYQQALKNNIELIDASCPVVLKLQSRIKNAYDRINRQQGQVIIYGKKGHAEVIGLSGQTKEQAIIVTEEADLEKIDFTKTSVLFSQTTKSTEGFYKIKSKIEERYKKAGTKDTCDVFEAHDSICRQVSNREPQLQEFARTNDVILFVSGKKSSNGRALFNVCALENKRSYFIENENELDPAWFRTDDHVGICGATSTPMWLMQKIAEGIQKIADEAMAT